MTAISGDEVVKTEEFQKLWTFVKEMMCSEDRTDADLLKILFAVSGVEAILRHALKVEAFTVHLEEEDGEVLDR